jgi:hypothetical protein
MRIKIPYGLPEPLRGVHKLTNVFATTIRHCFFQKCVKFSSSYVIYQNKMNIKADMRILLYSIETLEKTAKQCKTVSLLTTPLSVLENIIFMEIYYLYKYVLDLLLLLQNGSRNEYFKCPHFKY